MYISDQIRINNNRIEEITGTGGSPGDGVYLRKSTNYDVSHNHFEDLDDHAIYLDGELTEPTEKGMSSTNKARNCGRVTGSAAFYSKNEVRHHKWHGNQAIECAVGFGMITSTLGESVQDMEYIGNSAEKCTTSGFSSSAGGGTNHKNIVYKGNKLKENGKAVSSTVAYGYNLQNIDGLTFDINDGEENNYDGAFFDNCSKVRANGGVFTNNGQDPAVTNRSGIRIGTVDDFHFMLPELTENQEFGMTILAGATDGLVLFGATRGNGTGAYTKDASTAADVVLINAPEEGTQDHRARLIGTAAPTSKTFAQGDLVENIAPALGGIRDWLNTAGGSPGTFAIASQVGFPEETATNIADVSHAINTANKFAGKTVWDSTNTRMMRARDATAAGVWDVIDGSASVTPS
jgi:hypothetical protein